MDGSEANSALAYGLASTYAFEGGDDFDGFDSALAAADGVRRSQDAVLSALNWAWLHRDYRMTEYGTHAAEGALWARAGEASGDEVARIFQQEAVRSYCRFLAAHELSGEARYDDVAVWVDGQLSGTGGRCRGVVLEPGLEEPSDVATLLVDANELGARGDLLGADAVLTRALAREPDNPQIILDRANVRRELVEATALRDSALTADIERGTDQAVGYESKIRKQLQTPGAPGEADWQDSLAVWRRSLAAVQARVSARRDSLALLSENADAWYDSATVDANRALEISPYLSEAYYIRGRVLYEKATWDDLLDPAIVDDMVEQFDLALTYDPTDGNAHTFRALALKRTDPAESAESYRKALETYPQLAWMWQDLAEMEYAQDRYVEAKRAMDVAIGILPERLSYHDDRAVILDAMGRAPVEVELERAAGYRRAALEIYGNGNADSARSALGGSAGILLLLAEAEPTADIRASLDRSINIGLELGLEPDMVFGRAAGWLTEEDELAAAVIALDSAVARNPYSIDHWQDRFSAEVDADLDLTDAARKAGHGIVAIGDRRMAAREFEAAVFAYWRATVYLSGAQLFGPDDQRASTDIPPTEELRTTVERMFDAEAAYLGGEAEMIDFFREFVAEGGGIEDQLGEGDLRERIRFVIDTLVEERAATG